MPKDTTATLLDAPDSGVKEVALGPVAPPATDALVAVIERLAANPQVDVDKLERIIELQRGILRDNARAAFAADFARMAPHIPEIDEHGQIKVRGELRSTYAPLEDIHKAVKPICSQYGFAIRHRTEWPADRQGIIRIVGILSHVSGHVEESIFEAPMDKSDYRTDIQSMGSTVSYGRRYTTMDLLNIATRKADTDGQRKDDEPDAPEGYDAWLATLEGIAESGMKEWSDAWNKSKAEYTRYLATTAPKHLAALKTRAAKVKAR